jgi:single-stranded-DNA-specific exonuclease
MQRHRWEINIVEEVKVATLQKELKINPILCRLLVARGITNYEEAFQFFRPKLTHLHDPYLMKDMDKAVDRIEKAIANQEKILVYGDYDVDGSTAVALVYSFFLRIYANLGHYQPDRYSEGYGISFKSIDFAAENGYTLIIALDCGIKAMDKVKYAQEKGIDYIICDHHLPEATIPEAVAVLDPKRLDCDYPYKELCGCGIGFKLVQAYAKRHRELEDEVYSLMDLLAVSIAADIVPMTGENRVMMHFGMKLINSNPSVGLKALLNVAQCDKILNVTDLVFVLAPRINAAGRIQHANYAVELLLEKDESAAKLKSAAINENNITRKDLDKDITAHALSLIKEDEKLLSANSTVVYDESWHKGVIGIVASRLIENFYRPTVVLTESNGKVVGSARSVKGFDLYAALEACQDYMIQFGGHKYAAGMTMEMEQVAAFTQRFEEVVASYH